MTARQASTLLLVRAGVAPLEVLMIKRAEGLFGGGWWVFPGGSVDPADRGQDRIALVDGIDDPELAGWVVAALRETAEEVGLCLTTPPMPAGSVRRADVVASMMAIGASFAGSTVAYLSNWITPDGVPRRFDTRFFLAEWTEDTEPEPDGEEVVECEWVAPGEMLERDRDRYPIVFPTIKHLELLAGLSDPAAALSYARSVSVVPIQPRPVAGGGLIHLLLPGEPGYEEAAGRQVTR